LLQQFNHIVTCYELPSVKILGLVLDAGGPNAGLFELLRKGEKVVGSWPSESCLYSVSPMDPERRIYHFHCSTHNQKSIRNSLQRSQVGGIRDFHWLKKYQKCDEHVVGGGVGNEKAVGFGWPESADIYYRDGKRSKAGLVQLTRMSMQAALLDQWSQMNVILSKAPFQVVSIIEMMVHVSQRLGCLDKFWRIKGKDNDAEVMGERKLVML
jgi:hypothetical protein